MALKPIHDWVLLRRDRPEERTAGGIIIPASAASEPSRGVVEAIGPGKYKKESGRKEKRFVPTTLKSGQWVFFPDYAARDVELDGEKITLIREEDILGTFEGRPKPLETKPRKAAGPQKAARRTVIPKKKTKTAPPKNKGVKKVKTRKTTAKKTSGGTSRKKTPGRVKKTAPKRTPTRKTAKGKTSLKRGLRKKTALKRAVSKKKIQKRR